MSELKLLLLLLVTSVVSDPQRPHGLQPSRLLRPWDFPGKNTGVGCRCLLQKLIYNKYSVMKYTKTTSLTIIVTPQISLQFKYLLKAPADEITFQITDGTQ